MSDAVLHHFRRVGQAAESAHTPPTCILLHGFMGAGRNLASLARRWSQQDPSQHLVLVDLRGHGDSPPLPADGGDLSLLARDVLTLADHLQMPSPVRLLGHSLGGRVALAARALAPERVGEVILLDISPSPTRGRVTELDRVLEALLAAPQWAPSRAVMRQHFSQRGISRPLTEWLLLSLQRGSDGVWWKVDRDRLRQLHTRAGRVDLWDALRLAPQNTWCIRGELSGFVPDAEVERLRAAGARVDTIGDAGHFVHAQQLEALVQLLTCEFEAESRD